MFKILETERDVNDALTEQRNTLGETQEEIEWRVNLTRGHLGKIEHGSKTWGKRVLRWTPTLPWLLEALGLVIVVMDRDTAEKLSGTVLRSKEVTHREKSTGRQHPTAQKMLIRMTRQPCKN